jgi:hypothetical protein
MADDGAFVSDSAEGLQLVFEAVWLSSLVLGLEIGWDTDASKTAWLGWRYGRRGLGAERPVDYSGRKSGG